MPELPEIETIKIGLDKKIKGLKIKRVEVLNPKTFQGDDKSLWGKNVLKVWRKAKVLGVDLSGNLTLLFHLKMSGQLILIGGRGKGKGVRVVGGHPTQDMKGEMPNKSTRVIFEFSGGAKLYFNDQRKFGWVKVIETDKVEDQDFLKKLGPEPLEKSFTWQVLKERIGNHKNLPVKVAIMDQSAISGVGNIYANEALFDAKIDPRRKVSGLSDEDYKKLHKGVIKALEDGIKYGGATRAHFVNSEGERGYFLDYAKVYGKDGEKCPGCKGEVKKIQLGGRGTYYCPNCQK